MFCPVCSNLLNISKTANITKTLETPTDVSEETDENSVIKRLVDGEEVTIEEVNKSKIKEIDEYKKLDKKTKTKVNKKINEIKEKEDDYNTSKAFFTCTNCGYSQQIKNATLVLSKTTTDESVNLFVDDTVFKNMIYSKILPHTRNYICHNSKCPSHKNYKLRDAVFFRPTKTTQTWYTCCACQSYWKI